MAALGTMAKKSRIECLNHAVVQKFMEQKWSLRARKWYWGCLSIYAIFLLFFTTYISLFTEGRLLSQHYHYLRLAESACSPFCYVFHYFLFIKFISLFSHVCVTGQLL